MVISMEEYAVLRKEFINIAKLHIKTAALNELKIFYREVINSARVFDNIQDIEGLIRVLEKRGAIWYDNITPLIQIAKSYLSHSSLNDKLETYDAWVKSYSPPYFPGINYYQLRNGESYQAEKMRTKNVPASAASTTQSNSDHNLHSSHSNKFIHEAPLVDVIDDNLSNFNNSTAPCNSGTVSLYNNFAYNGSNCTDRNKINNDCKKHDMLQKLFNITQYSENLVSKVETLSDLITENERVHKSSTSTEDIGRQLSNTSLLATPLSVEPQARVSSLKRLNSIDHGKTLGSIQRRYVINLFIFLTFTIILVTLLIVYGFSKNPVHYNPEPSAPPFQEVPNVYPGISGNPCAGYSLQLNQNLHGVYNTTRPSTGPLQTISEKERRLQNYLFEQLSKRLGRFWQDVARQLEIRECEINNIDKQYPDLQDKAYAALKLFANETNLQYWQSTLKKALEKARRKDLAEKVEEISNYK